MHRRRSATLGIAALALGLAVPAWADHDCRAERFHRSHRHHRHGHGDGDRHHARRAEYRCGPCHQRWEDYGAFQSHLHRRHHVPLRRIPQVIVEATFGWIFYG